MAVGRQRRGAGAVDGRVVGIRNDRPESPALLEPIHNDAIGSVFDAFDRAFGVVPAIFHAAGDDEAFHLGVSVDSFGLEIPAKGGFRVEVEDRCIDLAPIADKDRSVIGNEFREKRDAEQHREDYQRPISPAVLAEIPPAASVEGREPGFAAWFGDRNRSCNGLFGKGIDCAFGHD